MIIVLHAVHAGLVLVGLAAVLTLLHQSRMPRGRVDDLRAAGTPERIVAAAERRAMELLMGSGTRTASTPNPWAMMVASGSLLAAAIHAFVSPEHYSEGLRFGVFFTLLTTVQLVAAVAVLARPSMELMVRVAVLNAGVVLLWGVSRTVGLPFGIAEKEAVGVLDLACSLIEVGIVMCCLAWVRRMTQPRVGEPIAVAATSGDR